MTDAYISGRPPPFAHSLRNLDADVRLQPNFWFRWLKATTAEQQAMFSEEFPPLTAAVAPAVAPKPVASVWSLQEAQQLIQRHLSPDVVLEVVPADGDCLFHCVRTVCPEIPVQALKKIAGCAPGIWGEEHHLKHVADKLGLYMSISPVELLRLDLGVQEDKILNFGDPSASVRLDMLHWTRDCRGVHFDVLRKREPDGKSCETPPLEQSATNDVLIGQLQQREPGGKSCKTPPLEQSAANDVLIGQLQQREPDGKSCKTPPLEQSATNDVLIGQRSTIPSVANSSSSSSSSDDSESENGSDLPRDGLTVGLVCERVEFMTRVQLPKYEFRVEKAGDVRIKNLPLKDGSAQRAPVAHVFDVLWNQDCELLSPDMQASFEARTYDALPSPFSPARVCDTPYWMEIWSVQEQPSGVCTVIKHFAAIGCKFPARLV